MEMSYMAGHLVRRLHQHSVQVFQTGAQSAGLDITPVQFAAMYAINANPGIEQAGVAALIAYDRATIGGVIERLMKKGYVSRKPSSRDRRALEVRITNLGASVLETFAPVVDAFQTDILPGLTPAEQATFLALARKAVEGVDDTGSS